jgi:ABC-type nitrate/sulfonate/bicarbonate transport system permease component
MSKETLSSNLRSLTSLLVIVFIWWLVTEISAVPAVLFPSPVAVFKAAQQMYASGTLMTDIGVSLTRSAVGFVIGATSGIFVGLLTARVDFFRTALNPVLTICRPIPAIALVPLAIVWFGIGEQSKYYIVAYTVFLTVWLNTHSGMENVPSAYIRASRSLGAPLIREFLQIIVPAASPQVVVGLRMGAALAFLSLVAAELTGAASGIGFRLQEARQYLRTDMMFVGLIELGLLGAALDYCFVRLGRRLVHWERM